MLVSICGIFKSPFEGGLGDVYLGLWAKTTLDDYY